MTEESKPQITSVFVDVHPSFTGKTIESRKYSPKLNDNGDKIRFDCRVGVPSNDEEAADLFGPLMTMAKIDEMGTRQHTYNETATEKLIKAALENGDDLEDEMMIDSVASAMREALIVTKKESKVSEAKELQNKTISLYKTYGLDPKTNTQEDLIAAIQNAR